MKHTVMPLQRFGRLTVLIPCGKTRSKKTGKVNPYRTALCKCECGKLVAPPISWLVNGRTGSCGCLFKDVLVERTTTHGKSKTSEYTVWGQMRVRCLNRNANNFHNYGGRGITICPQWDDFEQFLSDMGPRPSMDHTLERKDTNGNYTPENCIWATWDVQCNNKRNSIFVLLKGEKMTLTQAARALDFCYSTAQSRYQAGWHPHRWFEPVAEVELVT